MNKTVIFAISLMTLLVIAGCAQPAQPAKKEPIKIGFMGPLSGEAAAYGESIKKGVELALADSGIEATVIFEDSKCDGKEAVTAINKLINVDGVQAIVGEVCSGATLAAAPIAEASQVVLISSSSTNPDITNAGDYIFRTVPSDDLQGVFAANMVYNDGRVSMAVLYSNEDYGVGLSTVLIESYEAIGGEVVATETAEVGAVDLRTQLTKIKEAEPEALFLISNSPDSVVATLKQIKELGIDVTLYGSEGLMNPDIVEGAAGAAEGLIISSVTSGSDAFKARHNAKYGADPGPFAAQAYDAFRALALTIKGGATTGTAIKDALYDVQFDGASGRVIFDENGDVSGNYAVAIVVDGEFVPKMG